MSAIGHLCVVRVMHTLGYGYAMEDKSSRCVSGLGNITAAEIQRSMNGKRRVACMFGPDERREKAVRLKQQSRKDGRLASRVQRKASRQLLAGLADPLRC